MKTSKNFGILDLKNVFKSALVVLGILAISAFGFSAGPLVASATESQVDTNKIYAKSLLDYECDATEWHFIITGIKDGVEAPSQIKVNWSETSLDVGLEKVTGHSAHYRTSENLDAVLVSARAHISTDWDGQFNVSHGPCAVEDEEEEEEDPLGTISVCKAIVDDEENVVDGSDVSGNFELSGLDFNSPAGILPVTTFVAPLQFNMDLFSEVGGNDAECVAYEDLILGDYYYGEEKIIGDDWMTPMYNDQHTKAVESLSDFFPYSGELFTIDTSDDSNRNTNADGHIVLTKERPNRTLVILNTYEVEVPPAPYCGDGIVNQESEECDGGNECTLECTLIDIPDNSCPFEQIDGRIIIDFEDGGKVMDIDGYHYLGPVDAIVPAGTYSVQLASFDGYFNRSSVNQPEEIWKLRLKDESTHVVDSNPSTDLPDDVDYVAQTDLVNQELIVPTDTNMAKAMHAAGVDAPTVNSVEPVCAALDVVLPNQKPVITLRGENPVMLYVGENYVEAEADVDDPEDGDIDNKLVISGAVNTDVADTYIVTYNATDTENLAADEVTRTVIVRNIPEDPKQCEDGTDNDGDNLIDSADPGCHSDGNPDNPDSYDPNDDDETHVIPYAPYCGDGLVNQEWEDCDSGLSSSDQCTAQCQVANQCVERAFARVNTNEFENHSNGDVSSDIFLGSTLNKIPASAWFMLYDNGTYAVDADISGYEDVPGLAIERQEGKIRTLLYGSHPHDGSKEHINGDVELFNIEVTELLDDKSGNNKLENGFDNLMDNTPGQDEVWLQDNNDNQSFFWLTVTTADDAFYTKYGDAPMCEVENQKPVITLSGDNPLIIPLFGTYENPGATANDPEDGDITSDVVSDDSTVDTNTAGVYFVTYDVSDSEGLAADTKTREVHVVDSSADPVCSDNADNDSDGVFDESDPGCWTDPNDPESYDPNGTSENQKPVITVLWDNPQIIELYGTYFNLGALAFDPEDGNISDDIVLVDNNVDTNNVGVYIITYDVVDSEGLAADTKTREVHVVDSSSDPVCSDNADNDSDGVFDESDPGCWTDPNDPESYDPNGTSENEIPVITLRGDAIVDIMQGTTYVEAEADVDDAEEGDIDGNLVIGGDVVDTNATGTYTVTYNAQDSLGAPAVEVTRTVNVLEDVTPVCSDQIDNDEDGATDSEDAGCWTDPNDPESYDPNGNSENNRPVISRIGDNVRIAIGTSYNDEGATANDDEDGDITSDIVTTGTSTVNVNSVGFYTVRYNVVDSDGLSALEVTRTVEVYNPSSNPVCTSNCGGGGGGGPIPNNLKIFNEKITVIGEGTALITWETNKPADSRVVYDDDSQTLGVSTLNFGIGSEDLGYEFTTDTAPALTLEHSMLVTNVNLEDLFYFRPLSSDGTRAIGIELSAVLGQVTGGTCEQLLFEFIRFGANNNPVEVTKLQSFLNDYEGNSLVVNGIYDLATFNAVVAFQNKYSGDILSPWGLQTDTGYVYLTTRKKINEIYCNFQLPFPLSVEQQAEVNAFRALLEQLEATGQPLPDTSNVGLVPTAPSFAEGGTPNTSLTEETTSGVGGLAEEGGEEGDDSLAAALEAVEGEGQGIFSRIGNFIKGIFR